VIGLYTSEKIKEQPDYESDSTQNIGNGAAATAIALGCRQAVGDLCGVSNIPKALATSRMYLLAEALLRFADYRSGDTNSQPAVELTALLVVGHRSLLGGFLETSGPMANCIWLQPSAGAVV
jgi:hypothetical protein